MGGSYLFRLSMLIDRCHCDLERVRPQQHHLPAYIEVCLFTFEAISRRYERNHNTKFACHLMTASCAFQCQATPVITGKASSSTLKSSRSHTVSLVLTISRHISHAGETLSHDRDATCSDSRSLRSAVCLPLDHKSLSLSPGSSDFCSCFMSPTVASIPDVRVGGGHLPCMSDAGEETRTREPKLCNTPSLGTLRALPLFLHFPSRPGFNCVTQDGRR
jgi:hypothetical protein